MQCGRRNVWPHQGVHRGKVLSREIPAQGAKGRAWPASVSRGPVATDIELAVELIELMLTVERGSLLGQIF